MTQPQQPLDYRSPRDERRTHRGSWRQLLLGAAIAVGLPVITWALAYLRLVPASAWALMIPVVIAAGLVLVLIPGHRAVGAGILLMIALAVLTVLGICAAVWK